MYDEKPTMNRRILRSVWALIINVIVWIVVPTFIESLLVGKIPDTPLTTPVFIYEFGAMFIILDVGAAFFKGTAVSVPFVSAAALLSAVYLWLVTNGGNLTIAAAGVEIGLGFRVLLYIIILPSIWGVVKSPLTYLVWRRARYR